MDRFTQFDDLKRTWTDRFVVVKPEHLELKRFDGIEVAKGELLLPQTPGSGVRWKAAA